VKVSDREYEGWVDCKLGACAEKPVVILMDSHIPGVVYCKQTREDGGSNADDIKPLIPADFRVDIIPTSLTWSDYRSVVDRKPVLVVVHASAFYRDTTRIDANQRLLNFLDALKGSKTKIIVYTRGLPDQSTEELKGIWKAVIKKVDELKPQVELFVMPKRQDACFRDPDDAGPFQNKVREVLAL
jgi:hypothetical protein